MKKATLLAPRNSAREILSDSDAQRMLDSGSWVIATVPKKPTAGAVNQRNYMRRRLEDGYRKLEVLLPEHVHGALYARRLEGESLAELLERLLAETPDDSADKSQVGGHK
ncbi:hypothetical protein ACUTAF_19610 [Pseudomonas sp. SP16.1]|uniref:hypothetical protein n=1 Tax=Pseudomonas sp. SP16.1 TaxID=3458854 RepID=UPI00404529B2